MLKLLLQKEMEKLGMQLSGNSEEENELYYRLQRNYIILGEKYIREHSQAQNIIDLDNDGIDDRITGYKDENHNGTDDRFEPEEDIGE